MDDRIVETTRQLESILACPRCHAGLTRRGDTLACSSRACDFGGVVSDGIVSLLEGGEAVFFDEHFHVMMHGSDEPGTHSAFYAQQIKALRDRLTGANIILDVGCGPRRPWEAPRGSLIIGVDPSYESLRHNKDVDLRVHGSATALPLASGSVDGVVCFYSLHHVVGASVRDNEALVRAAFREFRRVLRPSGQILVFEVAPWWPVWALQRAGWTVARRLAGPMLAMFFWSSRRIQQIAEECLPPGTELARRVFRVSPWTTFPPAFAVQRFRLPRLLYPFEICLYHWRTR
jgi:SAM-dependent methyltransferase